MHEFFAEKRLVFRELREDRDDTAETAAGLANKKFDSPEGIKIMEQSRDIRRILTKKGIFNQKEQQIWEDKLNNLMRSESLSSAELSNLEMQLESEQSKIQGLVEGYTQQVMNNKREAFAVDSSRNLDTASEYIEWFKALPNEDSKAQWDKVRAYGKLSDEIRERIELRKQIVKLRPDLAKEVTKWRRSEMQDRLEEIEACDKRINLYESWLDRDKEHFGDKSIEKFKKELRDLTPEQLDKWIEKYPEETLKPRKELTDKFKSLPKEFQDSGFSKLSRHEKVEFFQDLERKIERDFDQEVDKVKSSIWSKESKEATKKFFRQVPLKMKAELLIKMRNGEMVKEDEKLTKEYNGFSKDVREMEPYTLRKWENCSIQKKMEMIEQIKKEEKLIKQAVKLLDYYEKSKVISAETSAAMFDFYKNGTDFKGRVREVGNFSSLILPRKKLLDDFESLDPKAQTKFSKFYQAGYRDRLKLFNEAEEYNNELIADKKTEKTPAKAEKVSEDEEKSKKMITSLQSKAKAYEEADKLEESLAMHETVLEGDPKNPLSLKKKEELTMLIEARDVSKDPKIVEALEKAAQMESMKSELEKIAIVREIFADAERKKYKHAGQEDVRKQKTHLHGDERALHDELVKQSGGEYVIDEHGEVQQVRKMDVLKFGNRDGQVHSAKEALRELGHDEHLPVQFEDETRGARSDHNKVEDDIAKREEMAAKELLKRSKGQVKGKPDKLEEAAAKIVEEQIDKKRTRI